MSGKSADKGAHGNCSVEAIVSVDERGQMVLPKDFRTRSGIEPGEKFALVSWERDGRMCCITLMRVDELAGVVKGTIGPLINGITQAR